MTNERLWQSAFLECDWWIKIKMNPQSSLCLLVSNHRLSAYDFRERSIIIFYAHSLSVSSAAPRKGLCLRIAHQGAGLTSHITRVLAMRPRLISDFLHLCLSVSLFVSPPLSLSILERWPQAFRWYREGRLWWDAAQVQSSVQGSDCVIFIAQAWHLYRPLILLWSSLAFLCFRMSHLSRVCMSSQTFESACQLLQKDSLRGL